MSVGRHNTLEEEEEEESLFKADAVDEEDWTRRTTFLGATHPYLHATAQLYRGAVSTSASKHRTDVRATILAMQVRGECSCGACRGSLPARLDRDGLRRRKVYSKLRQ